MNKKKLTLIACILIGIGVIGSLFTYRIVDPKSISEEKIFEAQEIAIIDVDTDNVGVNVYPTTEESIKVILKGETSRNVTKSFNTDVRESTLFITYDEKLRSWFNFDLFNVLQPLTLNVYLPEKQYEMLKLSSNNGAIVATELNAQQVELDTDNGRVEFEDLDAQGINVESNNGRIALTNVSAQNVNVKSDNGRVTLDHVDGKLIAETNNGGITLVTKELDRDIRFKSNNGKISITSEIEPTNVQFNVSVHNGRVNILDKYQGSTTIGNGDHLIELTTHNGSITVD